MKVPVVKEAAALGTALYAGVGAGLYGSIKEAVDRLVQWETTFTPNMENHLLYLEIYETWRKVYAEQLKLADLGVTTHMWKAPGY